MQRLLCSLGFHKKPLLTERVYLLKDRPAPVPSYEGIPQDAQVSAVVTFWYFTDIWDDVETCLSCKRKIRTVRGGSRKEMQYNRMIFLRDGKPYIVNPALIDGMVTITTLV